jgi:two-component system response regulator NreC
MSISVFLADDHEVVRTGLRALLAAEPGYVVVGEAADGLETVRLVERLRPDVLVLDLMMPGLSGLESLRILRQRCPQTRVVVFSMYEAESFVAEALQAGAAGYVLKGGQSSGLLTALAWAMAGRRYLSPPLSEQALKEYHARAQEGVIDPHEILTPRERQVFQLAAEGHTCPQIAARLHISERTVEMHRSHLMHKLGLRTQTELVLFAVRRGILPDQNPGDKP